MWDRWLNSSWLNEKRTLFYESWTESLRSKLEWVRSWSLQGRGSVFKLAKPKSKRRHRSGKQKQVDHDHGKDQKGAAWAVVKRREARSKGSISQAGQRTSTSLKATQRWWSALSRVGTSICPLEEPLQVLQENLVWETHWWPQGHLGGYVRRGHKRWSWKGRQNLWLTCEGDKRKEGLPASHMGVTHWGIRPQSRTDEDNGFTWTVCSWRFIPDTPWRCPVDMQLAGHWNPNQEAVLICYSRMSFCDV